jgi:hypothetical protein
VTFILDAVAPIANIEVLQNRWIPTTGAVMAILETHAHSDLNSTLEFLKRTRAELRQLRHVRIWVNRLQVIDVNKDAFEVTGLGYRCAEIVPVLHAVNTAFNPETIHAPASSEYKEFDTGRRHCWAEDQVM